MGKTSEQSQIPDWNVVDDAVRTSLLRFSTAGSVDDGKSTLIGRLLHDNYILYAQILVVNVVEESKIARPVIQNIIFRDGGFSPIRPLPFVNKLTEAILSIVII